VPQPNSLLSAKPLPQTLRPVGEVFFNASCPLKIVRGGLAIPASLGPLDGPCSEVTTGQAGKRVVTLTMTRKKRDQPVENASPKLPTFAAVNPFPT